MRTSLGLAAMVLAIGLVAAAPVRAETPAEQAAVVEGVVTKIDPDRSRVTVRASDGTLHEFEASPETLKDLKVGDRIEAKKRPPPQ